MHKVRGKIVNILGFGQWIMRASSSTECERLDIKKQAHRVKELFIHTLTQGSSPLVSPAKIAAPPLDEHYFYPTSTAPINNYNQGKIKER